MKKLEKPVGYCTLCRCAVHSITAINQRCGQSKGGKRCQGTVRSAIGENDWCECETCLATGRAGGRRCGGCDGAGWLLARRHV